MVIYEVHLIIDDHIFHDYLLWLKKHIKEMLKIDGFLEAKIFSDISSEQKKLLVQYSVSSLEKLNHYFKQEANAMRQHALDLFGQQFTASRRILTICSSEK